MLKFPDRVKRHFASWNLWLYYIRFIVVAVLLSVLIANHVLMLLLLIMLITALVIFLVFFALWLRGADDFVSQLPAYSEDEYADILTQEE